MLLYISIGIVILAILFFVNKKFNSKAEGNYDYYKHGDQNAQMQYNDKKYPKGPLLSLEQLANLSWKFLYDITEVILSKFSVKDQHEVKKCGKIMLDNGAKYNHIVEDNPKVIALYTQRYAQEQKVPNDKQIKRI